MRVSLLDGLIRLAIMDDKPDSTSIHLFNRARLGNDSAQGELISRYRAKLVALATTRLPQELRARLDPEDVIQSACRVFINRMREGDAGVNQRGDLWKLLVNVTLNKIRSEIRKHRRSKRSVFSERAVDPKNLESLEPTTAETFLLVETVNEVLAKIGDTRYRRILLMRLEGASASQISKDVKLSVERVRQIIRLLGAKIEESFEMTDSRATSSDNPTSKADCVSSENKNDESDCKE